jgi:hypothetical protein
MSVRLTVISAADATVLGTERIEPSFMIRELLFGSSSSLVVTRRCFEPSRHRQRYKKEPAKNGGFLLFYANFLHNNKPYTILSVARSMFGHVLSNPRFNYLSHTQKEIHYQLSGLFTIQATTGNGRTVERVGLGGTLIEFSCYLYAK